MKRYKRKRKRKFLIGIFIIIILLTYSVYMYGFQETFGLDPKTIQTFLSKDNKDSNLNVSDSEQLVVQFLDVGQADAIWIQSQDENMLIDAGNNNDGSLIVSYLKEHGVSQIKYVVGTHPHEDHIGGLDDIIRNFQVSSIYMPDVITTTSTFMDVLDAIESKGLKFNVPKIGETWSLGKAKIEVMFTGKNEKDLNSSSIVLKLTYGDIKFLFTGDATNLVEKELVKKDIRADVLKIAHHGSPYSTTATFLDKCHPRYAVISVGTGNHYGHPGQSLLSRLKKHDIEIYRTDELGTIIATTDGKSVKFSSLSTNVNGG